MLIKGLRAAAMSKVFDDFVLTEGLENAVALPSGFLGYLNKYGNPVFKAPKPGGVRYPLPGGGYISRKTSRTYLLVLPDGTETLQDYPSRLDSVMSTGSVFYGGDLKKYHDPDLAPADFSPLFLHSPGPSTTYEMVDTYHGNPGVREIEPLPPTRLPPIDYDPPQYDLPGSSIAPPVQTAMPPAPAPAPAPAPSGGGASAQANEWYFDPVYDEGGATGVGNQTVDVTGAKMSPWPILLVLGLVLLTGSRRK